MPVSLQIASHEASPVQTRGEPRSAEQFLHYACQTQGEQALNACGELLQSSLSSKDSSQLLNTRNGFVDTVVRAYNQHHHLIIRPDDVWTAILTQFQFYVNAHAEELRSKFVAHEGKEDIEVSATGNRYTVDYGGLAKQISNELHKKVVDKDLVRWILPSFSTTTDTDTVVCAILLMATLKEYFSYSIYLMCGIPSITLDGTKADWQDILSRIDKFDTFGDEPTKWAGLLRPILSRFVAAFDNPEDPDKDFWGKICHYQSGGSGPSYLSGWITAFCVWNSKGGWQQSQDWARGGERGSPTIIQIPLPTSEAAGKAPEKSKKSKRFSLRSLLPGKKASPPPSHVPTAPVATTSTSAPPLIPTEPLLSLDETHYPVLATDNIPMGHCEVDVKLDDNGQEFKCKMLAGQVAIKVVNETTVQPGSAWFMFVRKDA